MLEGLILSEGGRKVKSVERARMVREGWKTLRERFPHASCNTICRSLAEYIQAQTGDYITIGGVRWIAKREGVYDLSAKEGGES